MERVTETLDRVGMTQPPFLTRPRIIKLPPASLRGKVSSASDVAGYFTLGVRSASTIFHVLRSNSYDLRTFERILDFGCCCGGTIDFLSGYVGAKRLYGCDSGPEVVAWCQRNLEIKETVVSNTSPPAPFPNSHFDFIYAFASFTHLSEEEQKRWLLEWRRILKDDGFVLVSLRRSRTPMCDGAGIPSQGFRILDFQEQGLLNSDDLILLGTSASELRRKPVSPLRFPQALVQEYERRPELRFVFDEYGLGRPYRPWRNLSLWDWALTNGGYDVPPLRHLSFEALYRVEECQ